MGVSSTTMVESESAYIVSAGTDGEGSAGIGGSTAGIGLA